MNCRCCDFATDLQPLWLDEQGEQWYRCLACGSDSSTSSQTKINYDASYLELYRSVLPPGGNAEAARSNMDWFVDHRSSMPDNSFLDVGHIDGGILTGMQERGFSVHGFDVHESMNLGPHTTIRPFFSASHFPQRYSAVMCREVIEHVDSWRQMLTELFRVTADGGFCQIQTPRPQQQYTNHVYGQQHIQLFAPYLLRAESERAGFYVVDFKIWHEGQAWLLRR